MSIRNARQLVVIVGATLLFAACSSSSSSPSAAAPSVAAPSVAAPSAAAPSAAAPSAAGSAASLFICGLAGSDQSPYSAALNKGWAARAAELGVKFTLLNSELDSQLQSSQMDQCIAQGATGVVMVALDTKAIVPAVKKASDAGIKVLYNDSDIDPAAVPYTIGSTGAGDYMMAQKAGKMAAEYLPNGGNVAIVAGNAGYGPTKLREDGFRDAIKDRPDIKIIDVQNADWVRQKAIQVSADQLTRFGDKINLFFTEDDDMGVGVLQSIKAANSKAKVVSLTPFPDSCQYIASGDIIGSVQQDSTVDGKQAIDLLVKAMKGETIPRENFMPAPLVTKDTLDLCPKG